MNQVLDQDEKDRYRRQEEEYDQAMYSLQGELLLKDLSQFTPLNEDMLRVLVFEAESLALIYFAGGIMPKWFPRSVKDKDRGTGSKKRVCRRDG